MKNAMNTAANDFGILDLAVGSRAIHYRFRKAFPELTKCFEWLNGGIGHGAERYGLLVNYVNRMSQQRRANLIHEVRDAQAMGLKKDRDFDILICNVLGLDADVLDIEGDSARDFVAKLHQELTTVFPV
jgi:hypothetical protein